MEAHPVLVVLTTCCLALLAAGIETLDIAWLSDMHLDPFYGTESAVGHCNTSSFSPMGSPGCDTPMELARSAVSDVKLTRPAYVVMSGDWMRHNMASLPASDVVPTFAAAASLLAGVPGGLLPLPNVAGSLGNNDFVPDYFFNSSTAVHPLLGNFSEILLNNSLLEEDEAKLFARCAYYSRDIKDSGLSIVSLNTLVWTKMLLPSPALADTDPCGQLAFLQSRLEAARARQRRVLIISHVPIGLNIYGALQEGLSGPEAVYFQHEFAVRYAAVASNYSSTIIAHLFGHTHRFSFIADSLLGAPLFIAPAISPIFGNNPSYLRITLNVSSLDLLDVQLRFLAPNKSVWMDGNTLRSILGVSELSVSAMRDSVSSRLLSNATMWEALLLAYGGGVPVPGLPTSLCPESCRGIFSCALLEVLLPAVMACVASTTAPSPPLQPTSTAVVIGLSCAAAVLIITGGMAGVLWIRKYKKTAQPPLILSVDATADDG
jgi:hypothetical protein